jgi:hypothetical protein
MSLVDSLSRHSDDTTSRRTVVKTGAKLAYAAPLIAATMGLSAQHGFAASPPTTTRYCGSPLPFGSTGWGGWSCPAGQQAYGGEAITEGEPVMVEKIAQPGEVYLHYTFGPAEWGYVVQNGAEGQTIQVCVDCA